MTRPANPPRRFQRPRRSRLGLWVGLAVAVLLGSYVGVLAFLQPHVEGVELSLTGLLETAEAGRIESALILDVDSFVTGTYINDAGVSGPYNAPYLKETRERLVDILLENRIPATIDQQNGKRAVSLASVSLPALILVVLFGYLVLSYKRGSGLFAVRSGARRIEADGSSLSFADVAGQDAAVSELLEIREFLAEPERYAELGAVVPKGVLLFGPPGCGKTLLARALAGEAGASFFSISGSDFVELYVGVGAARVRDLFREARENVPAIIFIDELDSVGQARGGSLQSNGEQEQALNQVLAEMDGFSTAEGIIVLAATNRPDILDSALLRPGRFDRTIGLERPDEHARRAILSLHANGKRLEPSVDLAMIARKGVGLTGADLAGVINDAALLAARSHHTAISQPELDQALQRLLEAPERQRRLSLRKRSIGRRSTGDDRITFADVAGVDDALEELREIKDFLAEPDRFAHLGARVPRGVLLSGPPGCGKTLLARAVAGEANAAFFSVAASEFVERLAGEGASRVRDLFSEARSVAPAIVFLDEVDGIGARRSAVSANGRESDQTLNQILIELDGFEVSSGVIVMAATNRPDILDPALVRPGRFDRQVSVSLPDRAGRRAVLALHAKDKPLAVDVDLETLAGLTRGFSGADLANLLNEAALLSARRGLNQITMVSVDEGLDRVLMGVASRGQLLSDSERRVVAYHEAGHALVAATLPSATPPHKISIVARGATLGHCSVVGAHDRVLHSRSMLIDEMAVGLGGWVSEDLVVGEHSSGCGSDLKRVNEVARRMVRELGMSSVVGPVAYGAEAEATPWGAVQPSEEAVRTIEQEVRRLIDEAGRRARGVLDNRRSDLDVLAAALLERETLSAFDLDQILGPLAAPTDAGAGPYSASSFSC